MASAATSALTFLGDMYAGTLLAQRSEVSSLTHGA